MKPWGGRFTEKTKDIVDKFNASISFDKKLFYEDITGSIAHCKMLEKQQIITHQECEKIIEGLQIILEEIKSGNFQFREDLEDIHMNIESRLIELIGEDGGKLHTSRSRNDQVALDIRLYVKKNTFHAAELLLTLIDKFNQKAVMTQDALMPGFTHLQQAQPILLAHHLLAYSEMFKRDFRRFITLFENLNECPLGAGALAGTTFPIDRNYSANLLGFAKPTSNSLDTVADRDFIVEFISHSSIFMTHLSKLSEELILWSTSQFNFVELSDQFSTGSSIMPQKKNPDIPELLRGKSGRVFGNLISILTILKSLPLAYNKDLQEDKEPLFDTVETIINSIIITTDMIDELKFNFDTLKYWSGKNFSTATEIADYLAAKGVPFRTAHRITGEIVRMCIDHSKQLSDLTLEELHNFSPKFDSDIFTFITPESAVNRRNSYGGTSKESVLFQIENNNHFIKSNISKLKTLKGDIICSNI